MNIKECISQWKSIQVTSRLDESNARAGRSGDV